jgi:hypothetical protein
LKEVPENETEAERLAREKELDEVRRQCVVAYAETKKYDTKRYERHGSVWLFLRLP